MQNIFQLQVVDAVISRIEKLTPETKAQWGKMTVDQMLAHCNVTYELAYENKHAKPGAFKKFMLKLFVKETVVGNKPFKKNLPTAPEFKMKERKDFAAEKSRLINYLRKTEELGEKYFDWKESHSFGKLSIAEWNNMFYKHLDHHLTQFGV